MLDITCLEFPCVAVVSLFYSAVSTFRSFLKVSFFWCWASIVSHFFIFNFDLTLSITN